MADAPRVVIVTGTPGAGKTTFARELARSEPRGIHLVSDLFYAFPAHPIDPTQPESQAQNQAILRALARAAGSFAGDGWPTVLDGIVGPWFLDPFLSALPEGIETDYVVLTAPLVEAQRRVRERDGPGASAKVEQMHRAFAELGRLSGHVLAANETAGRLAEYAGGRSAGRFRVALGSPAIEA